VCAGRKSHPRSIWRARTGQNSFMSKVNSRDYIQHCSLEGQSPGAVCIEILYAWLSHRYLNGLDSAIAQATTENEVGKISYSLPFAFNITVLNNPRQTVFNTPQHYNSSTASRSLTTAISYTTSAAEDSGGIDLDQSHILASAPQYSASALEHSLLRTYQI